MPLEQMPLDYPFGWNINNPPRERWTHGRRHDAIYHGLFTPNHSGTGKPHEITSVTQEPTDSYLRTGAESNFIDKDVFYNIAKPMYYPSPTPNEINPFITITNPSHIATPHLGYPIVPKGHRDDLSLPLDPDSTIEVGYFDPKEAVPMTLYHPPDDPKLMSVKVWFKHPRTSEPVSMVLTEYEARTIPDTYLLPASKLPSGQWRVYAPGTRSEKRGVWPFGLMG